MSRPAWVRDHIYVGGAWVEPSGALCEVANPASEQIIGSVRNGAASAAAASVLAAERASAAWASTTPSYRAGTLRALAAGCCRGAC